ncbi:hypothetical protein [Paenibacillus sp. BC26]|uniref:hypothetical protein n=1 Tax=Paenibacillus sp. BC26 TaxID=1881032 RepID=UPI0008EE57A9|nr:hypothetical protein [Paenibacillus sp. BC26]SFT16806.1 protein CcmA, bactofilin family [Paenibacillus sp. BC26]
MQMMTGTRRKVRITGTGSTSGGYYESIRVLGEGQVLGSIESESLHSMGNLSVSGDLKVGLYRQVGETNVRGDIYGAQMHVLGELDAAGSIRSKSMKVRGQLAVRGECEAEYFDVRGGFQIHGLVSANVVEIRPWGPCHAKEIGGGRINVRRSKWGGMKQWFSKPRSMELNSELIEGENIYLEHTTADVVRGTNVTIGPGCRIGLIEYRKSLKVSKGSVVNEEIKR